MRFNIIGFALGVCLLQQQPQLPPLAWAWLLAPAAVLCWRLSLRAATGRRVKFAAMLLANVIFAAAGYFYAAAWAHWRLAERLAPQWEGVDLGVTGVVAGLPQPFERGVRFDFDVEQVEPAAAPGRPGAPCCRDAHSRWHRWRVAAARTRNRSPTGWRRRADASDAR